MKLSLGTRLVASAAVAGLLVSAVATDASARTARGYYMRGHVYGGGYGRHYRHYGPGAAVAGAALGVIGLAAGAAAANSYFNNGYDNGYGYAPAYGGGYGYAPNGYYAPY